jgi:DNA-binding PadR family transcriptional regulator
MHGYELRKRVNVIFGWGRVLSYGSLYPCLKALLRDRLIVEQAPVEPVGRRARIVYSLTADGKERFADLICEAGPAAWDDDSFDVHFAFFARTDRHTRVRILEGRRSRLEERWTAYAPPPPAPRSGSTPTPSSSSAMASSRWNARCGGSPS